MGTHLGHSTSTEHEGTRRIFFGDPLFEEFTLRPLVMDGCPLGEVSATASLIEEGDPDGWFREWTAAGDRLAGYGDASTHADHAISASGAYVKASSYYRAAYLPLYGSPVDPTADFSMIDPHRIMRTYGPAEGFTQPLVHA